ncbi:hypothetical protein Hanom_Chr10g00890301 [Helianthus anomalus]
MNPFAMRTYRKYTITIQRITSDNMCPDRAYYLGIGPEIRFSSTWPTHLSITSPSLITL